MATGHGRERSQQPADDDDGPGDDADGGGGWEEDETAADKTPADLRRAWDEAAAAVRHLERRGGPRMPAAVLERARAHRDEAEMAWRAAKPLHPIGKRLRWAAEAVEAAMDKQRAHRAEVDEFEEDTAKRRAELLARQKVDDERVARKQRELDLLRAEAGPTGTDDVAGRRAMAEIRRVRPTMWATRVAFEGIQSEVGPALERAVEALPEGSPAWMDLQGILSTVTNIHGVLAQAVTNTDETCTYNIGDGDSAYGGGGVSDPRDGIRLPEDEADQAERGAGRCARPGGRSESPAKCRAVEGPNGSASRWVRRRECGEGAWQRDDSAQMLDVPPAARDGHAHPQGSNGPSQPFVLAPTIGDAVADVTAKVEEAERQRREKEEAERRQLAASCSPEQLAQAENLLAQQNAAAATGFGSAEAAEIARRVHLERVEQVVKAAREKDIDFNYAELRDGSAEELEDWAQRHI